MNADGRRFVRPLDSPANDLGGLVATYTYSAFGEQKAWWETYEQPFKFAGAHYDSDTGFYKMGARLLRPAPGPLHPAVS